MYLYSYHQKSLKLDRENLDNELREFYDTLRTSDSESAELVLDRHIEKNPNDEVALCHKACYEKDKGEINNAIEYLKRAVKITCILC